MTLHGMMSTHVKRTFRQVLQSTCAKWVDGGMSTQERLLFHHQETLQVFHRELD